MPWVIDVRHLCVILLPLPPPPRRVSTSVLSTMSADAAAAAEDLPYNPSNVLLREADVLALLQPYWPGARVRDINNYRQAFVHRSYCTRKNENFVNGNLQKPDNCLPLQEESNERLEFLGDAVVGLVVGSYMFERYPDENEGFLTRMRTKLVNGTMMAHLAKLAGLEGWVIISKQIEDNEGRASRRILEDAFEAFVGALFTDSGEYAAAEQWIVNLIETHIDFSDLMCSHTSHKDLLIKHYQHNYNYAPRFLELGVDGGAASGKTYTVCIKDRSGAVLATGAGPTKKQAENDAARQALAYIGKLTAV